MFDLAQSVLLAGFCPNQHGKKVKNYAKPEFVLPNRAIARALSTLISFNMDVIPMQNKQAIIRWTKAGIAFALAGIAIWRAEIYVDPDPHYPGLAVIMCGLWAISLVLLGLGFITQVETE